MKSNNSQRVEVSIVILCYAAGDGIVRFVREIMDVLEEKRIFDYELVLVANFEDTNDPTPKVVKKLASQNSKIRFTAERKKGMMGWDMKSGMSLARGNYIAVIDGDGQSPAYDLVAVYKKIKDESLDLVKVNRVKRKDGLFRKFLSYGYNVFFKILFPKIQTSDINAKPKIMTQGAYQRMNLTSDDWFIDAEMMIQAQDLKLRMAEIPTIFLPLQGRRSFVNIYTIFEFMKNLILYKIRRSKK